jgi:poly(3-hydroxybutyrate) depolymerase
MFTGKGRVTFCLSGPFRGDRLLYSIYETNRTLLMPMRAVARSGVALLKSPVVAQYTTPLGRDAEAAVEVVEGMMPRRGKPGWRIKTTKIDGAHVKVSEKIILDKPFGNLLRFRRDGARSDPKILVVAPMSGHYATLLRDTVQGLLPAHDVYVTDWKDAVTVRLLDGGFDTDDYVNYIMDFMRQLGPHHHVMAVCQPAPLVTVAVALLAQWGEPVQPRSMTLMGGPIDTAAASTAPTELAGERSMSWFKTHCVTMVPWNYPAAHRRVYPGFLQLGAFIAMNADRHMNAHRRMFRHLVKGDGEPADAHRKFYDEYMAVMDITADFYLQTIRRVFKEWWIASNQFVWRGEVVRPEAIRQTALLTVEADLDDISAPGQTMAAHDICSAIPENRRCNHLQKGVGHYGIFNGRRWREYIVPEVSRFVREMAD